MRHRLVGPSPSRQLAPPAGAHRPVPAVTTAVAVADGRRPPATEGPGATWTGPQFSVVVGRFRDTFVVTLHGPLDLAASVALAGVLRTLMDGEGCLDVVLDLGDVGAIDGTGVDVLASAARRMAARGGELSLARPGGAVADSLAAADLGRLLSPPPDQPRVARAADRARRASLASHPAGTGRFHPSREGNHRGPL